MTRGVNWPRWKPLNDVLNATARRASPRPRWSDIEQLRVKLRIVHCLVLQGKHLNPRMVRDLHRQGVQGMTTSIETPPPRALTEPTLVPLLDKKYALGVQHLLFCALFAGLFLVLSWSPLRVTDLWGHVIHGDWIIQHRALPALDPMYPLSHGMRIVDSAWLSQVIFAWVNAGQGPEGLSTLYAGTMIGMMLVLARGFYLQANRSMALTLAGLVAVMVIGWSRLFTIRPENFSALAFAVLLWLVARVETRSTTDGRDRLLWLSVPLLFAAWANLHGSFSCGLAVLVCLAVGNCCEAAWRGGGLRAALADRATRQWIWLTELALLATLINPYGIDLWIETVQFARNENLRDVVEWFALEFTAPSGLGFSLSLIIMMLVLRHGRKPMPVSHGLMLLVFGIAAATRIRMVGWYAPLAVWVMMPQLAEIVSRWRNADARSAALNDEPHALPPGRSWKYTLVSVLLIWCGFALSAASRPLLGGDARTAEQLFDPATPIKLTQFLKENPPQTQIYNPQWWGDWLVYRGPAGLQPMTTSNIHLAPRSVWLDYQRISQVQPGWQEVLERYRAETLVVDKAAQGGLATVLRRSPNFKIVYEDEQGAVFQRAEPSPSVPASLPAATSVAGTAATAD